MRCERCSEQVKPIALVDIDGTLADYHTHLARFVFEYWNIGGHTDRQLYFDHGVCRWDGFGDFEEFLGISQAHYREAKLAFRQGGMKRNMPIYPEAWHFVEGLHNAGLEVWITTTRPWQRLDNVDPDTREWLSRHKINYHRLLFDDEKYHRVCDIVDPRRIVAVFDDLPEQVDACLDLKLPVFQVARNHNSAYDQVRPNRGSLLTGSSYAMQQLRKWRRQYERPDDT